MFEEYRYVDVRHGNSKWERMLYADLERWLDENGAYPKESEPNPAESDFFHTVQAFANPVHQEHEKHWCPFFMDFDSDEERGITFEDALRDARFAVDYFLTGFEVMPDICFSGNRGFHILVPGLVFGAEPSAELTYIWKHLADKITSQLGLVALDKRVYSRRRQWRIAGTKHSGSNLYKTRLELGNFRIATAEAIRGLAIEPLLEDRELHVQDVSESDKLKDLFRSASSEFQDRQKVIASEPVEYFFQVARRRV